jgi:hypothetical protein
MQIIFRKITWHRIVLFVFVCAVIAAIADSQEKSPPNFRSILININSEGKFIEFKLQDGNLVNTNEGKLILIDKELNTYVNSSDDFKDIYNSERLYDINGIYNIEIKDKLVKLLARYDMEKLYKLRDRFIRDNANINGERYYLEGPGKEYNEMVRYATRKFLPNKQFSYVVYLHRSFASVGVLIDLKSKEISFPFGLDKLENAVWNKEGRYIAYSTPKNNDSSQSILVIKDITINKTLLRKNIGKYVSDIAWSPDSSHVALLTYTGGIGLLPWEILFLAAGHPNFNSTFCLEIYGISGTPIYNEKIKGNFKKWSGHSKGRLVWIP